VVRDAQDNVFGVYMNEAITRREGTYYGSGESFVHNPKFIRIDIHQAQRFLFKLPSGDTEAQAFRWTGKNQYFALCEAGFISFGGG
jgi:hypothetical protein